MMIRTQPPTKLALILGVSALMAMLSASTRVKATIDIEVATESGLAPTAPQQWAQTLGKLGLGKVRIRQVHPGDQPALTEHKMSNGNHYRLLAILDHRGKLHLPGAKFDRHEISRLRVYLKRLQDVGVDNINAERDHFGLTRVEFDTLYQSLSRTITVPTQGKRLMKIIQRQSAGLPHPLEITAKVQADLQQAPPSEIELQGMTIGTSWAMLLRRHGLALVPQKPRDHPVKLAILPSKVDAPSWPIGWQPKQAPRQIAPQMYKFLTIEIDRYTLSEALDAMRARAGIPLWYDRLILERRQIVPDQIPVKLARGKTYLRRAIDRILVQARLAGEMRVDEKGHPFYWITQYGPGSARAE